MLASSTAKINGHYDFFSGLITLDGFSEKQVPLINLALTESPPQCNTPQSIELRDIRALVKHEVTHFLDHLTTIWGREFLYRRNLLMQSLTNDEGDITERLEVYSLNLAELQMHSDLVKIHKNVPFSQCNICRHELTYHERYGPIVIVKFFHDDSLVSDVPLSMLSLLEANAIANEYLTRFDDLANMPQESKDIAEAAVERRLQKILDESELSEYSVLIRLAKMHFTFLDTYHLLRYVNMLVNFSLNAPTFSLSTFSELIRHSFNNKRVGNGIWADMCRGMSRHIIAFKTIMFMHNWINLASVEKRQQLVALMAASPYEAIEMFWSEHSRYYPMRTDLELSLSIQLLKKSGLDEEANVVSQVEEKNQEWLDTRNLRHPRFDDVACLDILLCDDSVVSYPRPIEFDVLSHSYSVIDAYNKVDRLLGDSIEKFHMPLQQASTMLETILAQKDAVQLRKL
jgi:hypothetical protein